MDIVRVFQQYAADQGYYFSYGTRSIHNLLTNPNSYEQDKVHILLEPLRRRSDLGEFGVLSRVATGSFMFVLRDNFDLNFFNEKGTDEQAGKFTTRIEPLLAIFAAFEKYLMNCAGVTLLSSETLEVTDALDANLTGLSCTMQMRVYE